MRSIFYILLIMIALTQLHSCNLGDDPSSVAGFTNDLCFSNALDNGHVFRLEGKIWLRGGEDEDEDEDQHFDISNSVLRTCQLNLELGREYYPALIEPAYVKVSDHVNDYKATERVIFLQTDSQPKVYPLEILNQHVLINDVIDEEPVMIVYDVLSDLGAVYRRNYCDTIFTFAMSGYAYWDYNVWNAANAFVLWDRETESLWWPLINKAVSGLMNGIWLVKHDESKWWETTWEDVLKDHPDALVLEAGQTMDPPENWPRYYEVKCK